MAMAIVDDEPVKLTVLYDSLNEESMNFITKQLNPTYEKLNSIMSVKLVPAGYSNVIL